MEAYITDLAAFLPNDPVSNDDIEDVLGRINNRNSKTKRIILKNNGIKTRHYAINPKTGELTHTNAGLTAEAIKMLKPHDDFTTNDIECLCCGTTGPDLMMPGHALMVAGELGLSGCESVTTAGICVSGMTAFKYACMNVASEFSANAVATGSELSSSYMRARFFTPLSDPGVDIEKKPIRAFDADFLRWMLSDGAGAAYISPKKSETAISLKVEWIENATYAGELDTCMYAGGIKQKDGLMAGWRETAAMEKSSEVPILAVRQDTKLLEKHIVETAMHRLLAKTVKKYKITPDDIDWYLPHFSSHYFKDKFYQGMKEAGFEIPYEKWFTNLYSKGNTGSAAIFIILEEIFKSGKLKTGEKLLCFIPESGRFSHCFMLLTVV